MAFLVIFVSTIGITLGLIESVATGDLEATGIFAGLLAVIVLILRFNKKLKLFRL